MTLSSSGDLYRRIVLLFAVVALLIIPATAVASPKREVREFVHGTRIERILCAHLPHGSVCDVLTAGPFGPDSSHAGGRWFGFVWVRGDQCSFDAGIWWACDE